MRKKQTRNEKRKAKKKKKGREEATMSLQEVCSA
jgi:hypothetical protein